MHRSFMLIFGVVNRYFSDDKWNRVFIYCRWNKHIYFPSIYFDFGDISTWLIKFWLFLWIHSIVNTNKPTTNLVVLIFPLKFPGLGIAPSIDISVYSSYQFELPWCLLQQQQQQLPLDISTPTENKHRTGSYFDCDLYLADFTMFWCLLELICCQKEESLFTACS